MNELARLSRENRELRAAAGVAAESFCGLSFDALGGLLTERQVSQEDMHYLRNYRGITLSESENHNLLDVFEAIFEQMAAGLVAPDLGAFVALTALGLTQQNGIDGVVTATEAGRRFRNRLLIQKRSAPSPG